ncbi:MAG TPA: nucleotidyltransferase domain-containing protein [Longimicrobiaceae bacterium]|jgi:predicted nucleotidyltransferase|nr:nucleotidyltransferase domain-containing protein [Longimicrobiaceae bacterium]
MEPNPPASPIWELAARAEERWPAIDSAREHADRTKQQLTELVSDLLPAEDASVVVFGSLARGEVTSGSDTDWTLLVDGQASSTHLDVAHRVEAMLADADQKGPGREATFGGLAFSHELLHRIGGGDDTNRNLTQRILLLLESAALGPAEAHERVIRGILNRYINEDAGWNERTVTVPRFLLNDVARYWRTVAVDFAYKRRDRAEEGWALRTIKLRMSRKLTYASGLLACFSCDEEPSITEADDRSKAVIEHLLTLVALTPLERIAHIALRKSLTEPAVMLFRSYDAFLRLLDDTEAREHLQELARSEARDDATFVRARQIGHDFQAALDGIFFGENGSHIPQLTTKYGVF